jgi:hypothetical protein
MAILQVRDIDDRLYSTLKTLAKSDNRSLSQEVISILEKYLSNPFVYKNNPTKDFLELTGSWKDDRSADEILADIKNARINSKRFEDQNGIFD